VASKRSYRSQLLAAAIACAFAVPAAARPGEDGYDRFVVRFKTGTVEQGNATARQRAYANAGRDRGVQVREQRHLAAGAELIRTSRKLDYANAQKLMQRLRNDPRVEYVQLDRRMKPMFTPNDTYYADYQWHYFDAVSGIGAPAAWDIATGDGITVAVIDTGITAHPDLDANVVAGYDFISDDATAGDGGGRDADPSDPGDFVAAGECGTGEPAADSSWHGTHVAGTVAAVTNNSSGMAGVAFDSKVQALRVLGKCGGWTSDIADAIIWASGGDVSGAPTNATPAQIINMSLGGGGSCDPLSQAAIDIAVANGSVVVVAAGNENDAVANHSPASCDNVVTVGSITSDGVRSDFSNYGAGVDISAPGGGGTAHGPNDHTPYIWSTLNDGATAPGSPVFSGYQGTSMASPHVAGVAALMQSYDVRTPAIVETVLKGTARAFGAGDCDTGAGTCGTGLLDAPDALAALDTPFLYIDDPAVVLEGNSGTKSVTFTVRLSEAAAGNVTFNFATASGTATSGTDFVASSLTGQTILAGQTSKTFNVTINGDTTTEADETFVANVSSVVGVTALDAQATATIVNDEATVLTNGVPLTGQTAAVNVDKLYKIDVPAGATDLTFTTTGGGGGDADIYVAANMSPTQGSDCASESSTSTETCLIADPDSGTWYLLIKAYSAYSALTVTASYTEPPTETATLSINDVSTTEGNSGTKVLTFTATLSEAAGSTVSFDIATANGTATAGVDYVASTLTNQQIPAGQLSKTFSVTINGDTTNENNETILANITNANVSVTDAQGVGTITNDDGPTLSINDARVGEGDSGTRVISFLVKLSAASAIPITFDATTSDTTALAGNDYVASSQTAITIPAGVLAKMVSVTVNGDTTLEPNETFKLTLTNANGATIGDGQANGLILNDEGPVLSVGDLGWYESDSGTLQIGFVVSLSQVSAVPVTFNLATANHTALNGSDYYGRTLTGQSIPAGTLSKIIKITTLGDETVEDNEMFFVNLSNASVSLYKEQAKGQIFNDDGPVMSISDATVSEGNSGTKVMTFTVSLTEAALVPVTYTIATQNGTAVAVSDYVYSSINDSIPAGQLSKTFSVTINGDATVEQTETFKVNISNNSVSMSDGQGIGTITNDD
jgi:serine protease